MTSAILQDLGARLHDEPTTCVLVGPSGAGKTTTAEALAEADDQIVSSDELRWRLCGDASRVEANGVARQILSKIVEYRAAHDHTTIVDTTALQQSWRRKIADCADDTRMWAVIAEAPADTCVDRQKDRDRQVPEGAVRRQHGKLQELEFAAGRWDAVHYYRTEHDQLVEVQ